MSKPEGVKERKPSIALDFFSLEAVDFGELKEEVSANPIEEDHLIMEAIQLAQQRKFDGARDVAESVLLSNPHNATALQVNASECESRQDWAEAAKFFLSGIHNNTVDGAMEHGFQTNIDLLRASRPRWLERNAQNKWDDVLTFKPRPVRTRTGTPEEKPPWYRLGTKFEEVLADPGYVNDLIESCPDPEEEREELRRVIWENHNYLDVLYAYYASDLNETWDVEKPVPDMIKHTGDEEEEEEEPKMLQMKGLMRILKDCKIPIGDVKVKLPLAVFNRVHVQGHLLTAARLKQDPKYTVTEVDPHQASSVISFYSFIETLIRCAYLKCTSHSGVFKRFEALMADHLKEFALKKQTKKEYLDFRNAAVQACYGDETTSHRLRRIFEYFITSYKANKAKPNATGYLDMTMTMNHVLAMMEKCNLFDPNYNVKKCAEAFGAVTCDTDLLPQEHPNNQNSEMTFWEFLEFLTRTARLKSTGSKDPAGDIVKKWVEGDFIPSCARVIPGKI